MTGSDDEVTPAGWYRQSDDPDHLRWWDGDDWTDDRMPLPAGFDQAAVKPGGKAAPAAAPAPIQIERSTAARPSTAKPTPAVGGRTRKATAKRMAQRPAPGGTATRAPASGDDASRDRRHGPQQPAKAAVRARPTPRPNAERAPTPRTWGPRVDASHRAGTTRVAARRGRSAPLAARVAVRALLLAGVVGLLYLGYTKLRDAEPERARTLSEAAEPVAVEDPDASPLAEAVLTLNDLPAGWAEQAHDAATEDICAGRRPASVIVPAEVARSGFSMGAGGPFIINAVSRFAHDDEAQAYVDLVAQTIDSCRAYAVEGSTVRLEPMSFPSLGDQTFAAQVTGVGLPQPISGYIVHLRVGSRVASFETVAFGDTSIEQEVVEVLARLVARRL
ncbi:MAG: DUF2510 domain-containing protein [Acidimicrobiales bacterium]|nr:DUF2510 domain-containing protein [Acidimicrobiales bacterium]